MEAPETRYVAVGDADVAYQVLGEGPPDILLCYGLGSHIDLIWEIEEFADFWERLSACGRVILFDRRGTGASGPIARHVSPSWEEWAEDLGAVLDALGSQQAILFATLEAGAIAILFAALHPQRVSRLVLVNTAARFTYDDNYQVGFTPEGMDNFLAVVEAGWGTPELAALIVPARSSEPEFLRKVARQMRASATPPHGRRAVPLHPGQPGRPPRAPAPPGADAGPACPREPVHATRHGPVPSGAHRRRQVGGVVRQ